MVEPASDLRHLDYLDGWRGLAIGLLLIGHFLPLPGINLGRVGVELFFVLSGLLMSQLLFIKAVPIRHFYRRRVSRVFPLFYVFLLVVVLATLALGHPVDWAEAGWSALFLNNYLAPAGGHGSLPLGHIWSLSVEEQSYVLLTLVALSARRGWVGALPGVALCCALTVAAAVFYGWRYDGALLEFGLFYHLEVAAFGIFASALLQLLWHVRGAPALPTWAFVLLAGTALLLQWWSMPFAVNAIGSVALLALLVNLLGTAPLAIRRCLSWPPLRQLGLWSFSIYIWQQPFYLWQAHGKLSPWLAMALAVASGVVSYHLLEKPMRAWLNAHWARPLGHEVR